MRWITREKAMVDRIACPWLIKKFIDPNAEFFFVPREEVLKKAEELKAIPFDVEGAELTHYIEDGEEYVSFDAFIKKYNLKDPALLEMAKIVRGADADIDNPPPESAGLKAMAKGFREISRDDFENMNLQFPAYDALYAYCKIKLDSIKK
ncbi:MAG: chromate resistance protein ChrB domain-containing protein [Thermoplasmata archaeon]